jgi:hypothetical protein
MSAGTYSDVIEQGANWTLSLTKYTTSNGIDTPFDLTGYSARCKLRSNLTNSDFVLVATCTIPVPASGGIVVSLSPAQTDTIPVLVPVLYYDVEIYTAGDVIVERLLEGTMNVKPNATR